MQQKIEAIIDLIDAAGGMYKAVEQGLVQKMIGDSALAFQKRVDAGAETVVGVNKYTVEEDAADYPALDYPDRARMDAYLTRLKAFKAERSAAAVDKALAALAAAAQSKRDNVFAQVVAAAEASATHGEICATLRREMGFGQPLTIV